tara:strand:+ start:113430 stop:113723 length:294 start_codon:yes stop_codon:yes gene_type:complete
MKLEKLKQKNKITLDKQLSAMHSNDLKVILLEALNDEKSLYLNASKVENIDTLCCQLLISAQSSFLKSELTFEINSPSEKFNATFNILGLQNVFVEA